MTDEWYGYTLWEATASDWAALRCFSLRRRPKQTIDCSTRRGARIDSPTPSFLLILSSFGVFSAAMDIEHLLRLMAGERSDPLFVCRIPRNLAAAAGAHETTVWLSRKTIEKHYARPYILAQHYEMLPHILDPRHSRVVLDKESWLVFVHAAANDYGFPCKVAVKASGHGGDLYVRSIHETRPRDQARILRKGLPLAG